MENTDKLVKLDYLSWLSFASFSTTSIIIGLCLPEISKDLNLNHFFGSLTETLRNFSLLFGLIIVITTVAAVGKKFLISSGQYILALGLVWASFSSSSSFLWLSFLLVGLGGGFIEAIINPLVVDLHPKNTNKYMNLTNAFYPMGIVGAALIFGELLSFGVSWRAIFKMAAAFSIMVALFFQFSLFPVSQDKEKFHFYSLVHILKQPLFWFFGIALFLAAGIESSLMFWSRTYIDSFLSQDVRQATFSVVIFASMMALGRLLTTKITDKFTVYHLMIFSAIIGIIISLIMLFVNGLIIFYILLALAGLSIASFWPIIMAHSVALIKVNITSLLSLLILFGISGYGLFPLIIGSISQIYNLKIGLIILPLSFLLLLFMVFLIYQKDMQSSGTN